MTAAERERFTVSIDGNLLLAVDETGDELLRFRLVVGGRVVLVRPPTVDQWRAYLQQAYATLKMLAMDADGILAMQVDMQMPDWTDADAEYATAWLRLTAIALENQPRAARGIVDMLMTLRPRVAGLPRWPWLLRRWLGRHATLPDVARMLGACMAYHAWQKKTMNGILKLIFPLSATPVSVAGSRRKQDAALPMSATGPPSGINISSTASAETSDVSPTI